MQLAAPSGFCITLHKLNIEVCVYGLIAFAFIQVWRFGVNKANRVKKMDIDCGGC